MSADLVAKCVRALHAEYVLSEVEAERITKIVLAIALPAPSGTEAMRDEIATIINPYAFMPDSSGDDLIADIVRQDKEHAYRQTDRILALVRGANIAPDLLDALQICIVRDPSLKGNTIVMQALAKAGAA